jgi:V/A-type H+-transporting ATPase subunit E
MEGIEKITGRILSDARAEAEAVLAAAKAEAESLAESYKSQAKTLRDRSEADARAEGETLLARVDSSGSNVRRNMILEEKNRLLDEAFALALEKLPSDPGYPDFLEKLLAAAIKSNVDRENAAVIADPDFVLTDEYEVRFAPADAALSDMLLEAGRKTASDCGKTLIRGADADEINNGFILRCGQVLTNCSAEKLIEQLRPSAEAGAVSLLFGEA